ncbi:MAG: hypothetical protein GY861_19920 [bacterium]|nr:hypothetical protein [bacterium]
MIKLPSDAMKSLERESLEDKVEHEQEEISLDKEFQSLIDDSNKEIHEFDLSDIDENFDIEVSNFKSTMFQSVQSTIQK